MMMKRIQWKKILGLASDDVLLLTAPTYYGRKIKIIGLGHQSVAAFNSYQVSLEREGMTVLGISNEMHNAGHRGNHKCVVIKVKIYQ